jgi:hypothetical protein
VADSQKGSESVIGIRHLSSPVSKARQACSPHALESAAQLILDQGLLHGSAPASRLADALLYSIRTMDAGSVKFTKPIWSLQINMEELVDAQLACHHCGACHVASRVHRLGGPFRTQLARHCFFTKDSSRQGTQRRSTETGEFTPGYRYRFNRWLAVESNYGYDRNTQEYFGGFGESRDQANLHAVTADRVLQLPLPIRRISTYALAGV